MPLKICGSTLYNTSEACKLAGTNRCTYLRWIREGKFHDVVHRDRNGWRLFTKGDIGRLKAKVNYISRVETTRIVLVSGKQHPRSSIGANNAKATRHNADTTKIILT
ncbi:hypothetical protein ACFLYR_07440 [Chloroflexota bacterium]